MSEQTAREATLGELAKKTVVYIKPGMEVLPVRRGLTFRSTSGAKLLMDVYRPSLALEQPVPVVLMTMAYPDPTARIRMYGPLTSWARLIAASGMAAISTSLTYGGFDTIRS